MLAKFEEIVKRSGAPVQLEGGAAGLASGGVVIHADGGAVSPLDGGAFGEEPRRSGRESKAPKDETSWKSASWADTVQKMHAVRVHSGEAQRTEMTRANAPIAEPAIGAMLDKKATYLSDGRGVILLHHKHRVCSLQKCWQVDVEISVEPGREALRRGNVCYGLLIREER